MIKRFIEWICLSIGYEWGKIYASHGSHTIFVPTMLRPRKVWVNLTGKGTSGCGLESTNMVGWTTNKQGITFFIDVKTDSCLVKWTICSD
jgi:hypothetical protein